MPNCDIRCVLLYIHLFMALYWRVFGISMKLSQMVLCSHEPEVRLQGRMLRYAPDVLAGVCAVVYRMRNAFSSK